MSVYYPVEYMFEDCPIESFSMRVANSPMGPAFIARSQWNDVFARADFCQQLEQQISYVNPGRPVIVPSWGRMMDHVTEANLLVLSQMSMPGVWFDRMVVMPDWDRFLPSKPKPIPHPNGYQPHHMTMVGGKSVTLTIKCQHVFAKFVRMALVCPSCGVVGGC